MKKNVSGQTIGAQMVSATDGSAFTGAVTVYVCGDAGTQAAGSVGSGACTHEGNGYHTYAPAQAETNYDLIAFTFVGTGAVGATVQVFTSYPQTGDAFARLGAPSGVSVSADIADLPTVTEFNARTLAAADYTVVTDLPVAPDNASITAILEDTGTTLDALIKDLPTNAELATALAGADDATLAAIGALNDLDSTGVQAAAEAALLAYGVAVGTVVAAVKVVTDKIDTALVSDGAVYQFTANALELAPTGGSAPTAAAIRAEIDANSTQLAAIVADTGELQTDWTNGGRLDTLLDSAAAGGGLDAAGVRGAIGLATANLDTQLGTIAKTGADSDTLETLSDQIDALVAGSGLTAQQTRDAMKLAPTAGAPATGSIDADLDAIRLITDAINTSTVIVAASNDAGLLTVIQSVTFNATVSGLTISGTWAKLHWSLKESLYDDDDQAIIQLVVSNPAAPLTDGLLYLDSAAIVTPITIADGTLTVNQAGGIVTIAVTDNATALLAAASELVWDIKTKDAAGNTVQNTTGTASIVRAVTQTI